MSDFIIADTSELDSFLSEARLIENTMKTEDEEISRAFSQLASWDDPVKERVGQVLQDIRKKENEIFDYMEKVFANLSDYIDDLDTYLQSAGRF